MLRNRRGKNDFMGYHNDNGMGGYPGQGMVPVPPISQLDATSERLAEQAEDIGWLKGQNDLLMEDNRRLEQENQALRENNERLTNQAREAAVDSGAHQAVSEVMDELKEALRAGKVKK